MIKLYLKTALRNLKRQKLYSVIIISGLAMGLASCFLLLSWARTELGFDSFHQNKKEIFRVVFDSKDGQSAGTYGALAPALKEEIPEIIAIARAWTIGDWQMHHGGRNLKGKGLFVDPAFLDMFSFPIIEGVKTSTPAGPHDIVLTKALAGKIFGPEDPLGKTLVIDNRLDKPESFSVAGVIEDVPRNSHIQFDFLFSYQLLKEWYRPGFNDSWSNRSFAAYARLRPDADVLVLNGKITDCYNRHMPLNPRILRLQPLSDVYLHPEIRNYLGPVGSIKSVRLFIGVAFLVLLISCINFANLSTALSTRRARDIGVRKYVGALRNQIAFQYLVEACLYALTALPVAFLFMELARGPFRTITGADLIVNGADPTLLAGAFVIVLLTGLAAGSYPALYLSSLRPVATMKGTIKSARTEIRTRRTFIVVQFSLSILIMAATFVISKQLDFIHKMDLGFDKENLIYTWTPGSRNEAIRNELLKNPQIIGVGASSSQLDNIGRKQKIRDWSGRRAGEEVSINVLEVDYSYLDTYRMKMAAGRYYSEDRPADEADAIIINEAAVRAMNIESPVGTSMDLFERRQTIIGVVKDFHFTTLHEEIEPIAFVLYPSRLTCLGIRMKSDNIAASVATIKSVLKSQLPDSVLDYRFLDERLNALYAAENRSAGLFRYFSLISITLSCLGLFGLASFMAERRRKEIGIRKTLGASAGKLVLLQLKEIFYLVVVSNVLAWPGAFFYMNGWLRNYAYRVDLGWWMIGLPGLLAALVALATVSCQAIRAATADPKESLRYE